MVWTKNAKIGHLALNLLKTSVAVAGAVLLFACGDDSSSVAENSQILTDVNYSIESIDNLLNCTSKHEGETAYVKEDKRIYVCTDGDWVDVDDNDDSVKSSSDKAKSDDSKDEHSSDVGSSSCMVKSGCSDGKEDESSSSSNKNDDLRSSSSFKYEQDSAAYEKIDVVAIKNKSVTGFSQKGPFVNGSSVKLYELDGKTFAQTGKSFTGKISNDKGEFKINSVTLASQYALLEVSGYYQNEVTGGKSSGTIVLNALTDLSSRTKVNVNLLTHLEYERALYLLGTGLNVPAAKKQAEAEVLNAFGIQGDFANSEELSIFSNGDGDAALLAFSVLMLGDNSEAELTELMTNFSIDIEKDGLWDDIETKAKIADWARYLDLSDELTIIKSNIDAWSSGTAPEFEKYVRNFWYTTYGLGDCDKSREGMVAADSNKNSETYYKNHLNDFCAYGSYSCYVPSETRYICKSGLWVSASNLEKDTYGWKAGTEEEFRKGNVSDNFYVYINGAWRSASNLEVYANAVCNASHEGLVVYDSSFVFYPYVIDQDLNSAYRICKSGVWEVASSLERDTYGWAVGEDGEIKHGSVDDSKSYVYDASIKAWREASCIEHAVGGCTEEREKGEDNIVYIDDSECSSVGYFLCKEHEWKLVSEEVARTYIWVGFPDGTVKEDRGWYFVYDEALSEWRLARDYEQELGGCTMNRDGEIVQAETYYSENGFLICENQEWRSATEIEYDTYGEKCDANLVGKTINGKGGSTNKYYCTADGWAFLVGGWSFDIPKELRFNQSITYGTMIDKRDNQIYKTIKIGNQVWMAENLNYADSTNTISLKGKSWCYEDDAKNCAVTGRLYTFAAAIDSVALSKDIENPQTCGYGADDCVLPNIVQGVCPEGWHLPAIGEWQALLAAVDGFSNLNKLRSSSGWYGCGGSEDAYGFSALPAGRREKDGYFDLVGVHAYFWMASIDSDRVYYMDLWGAQSGLWKSLMRNGENYGFSIRCLQDSN